MQVESLANLKCQLRLFCWHNLANTLVFSLYGQLSNVLCVISVQVDLCMPLFVSKTISTIHLFAVRNGLRQIFACDKQVKCGRACVGTIETD